MTIKIHKSTIKNFWFLQLFRNQTKTAQPIANKVHTIDYSFYHDTDLTYKGIVITEKIVTPGCSARLPTVKKHIPESAKYNEAARRTDKCSTVIETKYLNHYTDNYWYHFCRM